MIRLLQIDSSARPGASGAHARGSHTRRLTGRFVRGWLARRPGDAVAYRDLAAEPPPHVTGEWVAAAFTPPERRDPPMRDALAYSDRLVDELVGADVLVVGVPMYNFGLPSALKAWVDQVVRVGRTFGFDRGRAGEPYWPLLDDRPRRAVLLGARGDYGYGRGGRIEASNHAETALATALRYVGVRDVYGAAVEYDEFGDGRLEASIAAADAEVDALVDRLVGELEPAPDRPRRGAVA